MGNNNNLEASKKYLLSIVIPTIGRESLIKTIHSILAIKEAAQLEIIIVGRIRNKNIFDELNRLIATNPNIRHIDVSFEGGDSSNKKNQGWQNATCEIIAFIDDDVLLDDEWAFKIIEPFDEMGASLVSGPALLPPDTPFVGRLAAETLSSLAAGYVAWRYSVGRNKKAHRAKWSHLIGCNMAYKRKVLEEIGGFDPLFWPGEEMLAAFKATRKGYVLVFNPEAKVYHYPRSTLIGFCKQMYGYGATRIRLIRAGVEVELSTLGPMVLVGLTLLLFFCSFFFKIAVSLLVWLYLVYLIGAFLVTIIKLIETRRLENVGVLFMVILMHISYGVGELSELFLKNEDLSVKQN